MRRNKVKILREVCWRPAWARYQLQMYPRISAFIALRIQKVQFQNNLRLIHEFSGTFYVWDKLFADAVLEYMMTIDDTMSE